jgi:hypothetical protein
MGYSGTILFPGHHTGSKGDCISVNIKHRDRKRIIERLVGRKRTKEK